MQNHKAELLKAITGEFRYKYDAHKVLGWLVDDCLGSFGIPLPETPPEDVQEALFDLSALYGRAVQAEPFQDVLGNLYQEIASKWKAKGLGQYFTPFPIAKAMAEFNGITDDLKYARDNDHIVKVCEPTAGSGVMLLAILDLVNEKEPEQAEDLLSYLSLTAIDVDRLCVKMTTLQIMSNALFHGASVAELSVWHGNSLGDLRELKRFAYATHRRWEDTGLPYRPARPADEVTTTPLPKNKGEQFKLF